MIKERTVHVFDGEVVRLGEVVKFKWKDDLIEQFGILSDVSDYSIKLATAEGTIRINVMDIVNGKISATVVHMVGNIYVNDGVAGNVVADKGEIDVSEEMKKHYWLDEDGETIHYSRAFMERELVDFELEYYKENNPNEKVAIFNQYAEMLSRLHLGLDEKDVDRYSLYGALVRTCLAGAPDDYIERQHREICDGRYEEYGDINDLKAVEEFLKWVD